MLRRVPWTLDGAVALVAFASTVAVFGSGSSRLGFYSDDSGFLTTLPHDGFVATLRAARDYVPGRNLHIIWQRLLFLVGGDRPVDLGTLHLLQSALDGITVVLFYVLLRSLRLPLVWALLGTTIFAFYPNHGETHYWLSSGPMNVMSTLFLLAFSITAVHAIRRAARTRVAPPARVFAVELLFFGLAMFTYDQTFFCLLLVVALQAGQMMTSRIRPTAATLSAGAAALALAALDIDLKQNPASGPTLAHAGVAHIVSNVKLSFSLTWGPIFRAQLHSLVAVASAADKVMALACAGAVFAIAITLIARGNAVGSLDSRHPRGTVLFNYAICWAAGVLAFFLGYLPADAWSISPRHNFLPTAGLALAVASAAAAASSFISTQIHRHASEAFALVCAAIATYAVFVFVQAGLAEKSYWAAAYQPRLALYRQLMDRHLLVGKSAIVFQNFPASVGPAPFFAQENSNALLYLFPGRVSPMASSISALETQRGYYLDNEIDRYGIADRYFPANAVLDVVYQSERADQIKYALGDARYRTSRFYSVRRVAAQDSGARLSSGPIYRASLETNRGKPVLAIELDLRRVGVGARENLGLLLAHRDTTEAPLTGKNPYGERMLIPIGLINGPAKGQGRAAFSVTLKDPIFRSANTAALYIFGSQPPRLLQTVSLAR